MKNVSNFTEDRITTLGNEQVSSTEEIVKPIQVIALSNQITKQSLKQEESESPLKINFTPILEENREESPDLSQRAKNSKFLVSRQNSQASKSNLLQVADSTSKFAKKRRNSVSNKNTIILTLQPKVS